MMSLRLRSNIIIMQAFGLLPRLLLLVTLVTLCQLSTSQFPTNDVHKFRHPGIQEYYRYHCRDTHCGYQHVCERRVFQCLVPPCPQGPGCVPTFGKSTMKPGRCPSPWYVGTPTVECNTDWGCHEDEVCCHGFYGSQCRHPLFN